jgi:superfamily II DNA or RNA helicase
LGKVGIPVEEISPTRKTVYERAPVYLAMIETLKRRMGKLEFLQPELIIIDEAHKGSFNSLFEIFPNARVIGATATPVGTHFYEYYTSIVQNIDVPDLVQAGFLVPCKAYQMQDDFSDLKVQRGEFSSQSLGMHYNKPTLYEGVIDNWKRYAQGKKTVVFNVSIEHTMNVHNAFLEAGISSGYITSKSTKEERERTLEAFKNGHFSVLNNCGILTTGWDEPSVECIVLNRATKSLPLFLQCMGRGSRLYQGKKQFIVLDFGGNHTRLGMWNENRIWEIKKKRETSGEAPVKACPECNAVVHASTPSCPECKFIFPVKEKEIKKGVMVEVVPHIPQELKGKRIGDLTISELCKLQKAKKYKATMIWRVIRSKGEQALYEYAQKMGYSDGWVYKQIHKLSDSTFTNYLLTA